jgi:hypothetical protein
MDLLRAMIIPGFVGLVVVALGLYMTRAENPAEAEERRRSNGPEPAREEAHHA